MGSSAIARGCTDAEKSDVARGGPSAAGTGGARRPFTCSVIPLSRPRSGDYGDVPRVAVPYRSRRPFSRLHSDGRSPLLHGGRRSLGCTAAAVPLTAQSGSAAPPRRWLPCGRVSDGGAGRGVEAVWAGWPSTCGGRVTTAGVPPVLFAPHTGAPPIHPISLYRFDANDRTVAVLVALARCGTTPDILYHQQNHYTPDGATAMHSP